MSSTEKNLRKKLIKTQHKDIQNVFIKKGGYKLKENCPSERNTQVVEKKILQKKSYLCQSKEEKANSYVSLALKFYVCTCYGKYCR